MTINDQHQQITRSRSVVRLDDEKRIVYGEVYVPFDPDPSVKYPLSDVDARTDTYDTFMRSETLERLAHQYMEFMRNIDVQHERDMRVGTPVESFIARDGDPDFIPGAWVMGTRVDDDEIWEKIKLGDITGYSIDVMARQQPVFINVEGQMRQYGELFDITPFFVSLVDKAANKRTFRVIRCQQEKEGQSMKVETEEQVVPVAGEEQEVKSRKVSGFLQKLKNFVLRAEAEGLLDTPESEARSSDFASDYAAEEPWRKINLAMNVLYDVVLFTRWIEPREKWDEIIRKAGVDWSNVVSAAMLSMPMPEVDQGSETRSVAKEEAFSHSEITDSTALMVRVGKKISGERLEKIRKVIEELAALVAEVDGKTEEERTMSEPVKGAVASQAADEGRGSEKSGDLETQVRSLAEVVARLEEKLDAKQEEKREEEEPLGEFRTQFNALSDMLKDMGQRLEKIEQRRMPSQQGAVRESQPKEQEHKYFASVLPVGGKR